VILRLNENNKLTPCSVSGSWASCCCEHLWLCCVVFQRSAVVTWFHLRMHGSNEKMTRSSSVVTRHGRRGSCVVATADGPASSPTALNVCWSWNAYEVMIPKFCQRFIHSNLAVLGCSARIIERRVVRHSALCSVWNSSNSDLRVNRVDDVYALTICWIRYIFCFCVKVGLIPLDLSASVHGDIKPQT